MNRLTQSVLMAAVGAVLLRVSLTDAHLRYVKATMSPYLVATGVLLMLIGVVTFLYDFAALQPSRGKHRASAAQPICCTTEEEPHDAVAHGPRSAWLLVGLIAAIVLIGPPTLGSYAANRTGTAAAVAKQQHPDSQYPPLPAGDPVTLSLLDYVARSAFEKGVSLEGRTVKLVGFISPGEGGGVHLARMMMMCCAADSRPLKVGLSGKTTSLRADQWVEVVGVYDQKLEKDPANGEDIPYLRAMKVKKIPPPDNPYDVAE